MTTYVSLMVMLIGLYGLAVKRHLIRKIMGLYLFEAGIILYFVSVGYRSDADAPILTEGVTKVVDPIPQALMLTAIVIGICVTALALSIAVRIHKQYGTLDVDELKKHLK